MLMVSFVGVVYYHENDVRNNKVDFASINNKEHKMIKENNYKYSNGSKIMMNLSSNKFIIEESVFNSTTNNHSHGFILNISLNGNVHNIIFITANREISGNQTHEIMDLTPLYTTTGLSNQTANIALNNNSTSLIAPDISASAGWYGWAVSLSPSNMHSLAKAILEDTTAGEYSAIAAFIVRTGIDGSLAGPLGVVAGLIAGVIVGIGFYYLNQYDESHGNPGVWFAATWIEPLIFTGWGLNPVPWGY
jgi:hypothetical protein